jgi:hypothetical protein
VFFYIGRGMGRWPIQNKMFLASISISFSKKSKNKAKLRLM